MKPADLSATSGAYITHFMFSAFFPLISSSCNVFSKRQSPDSQCSSELASPFCYVIPDHTCLVQQDQRIREAQTHLQAISTCRTDRNKAWPHMSVCRNTETQLAPRPLSAGTEDGQPLSCEPLRQWQFPSHSNIQSRPKHQSIHLKAGLRVAQSTGCATGGCMQPLSQ